MSSTKSLLVELFVEELPPKSLKKLGDVFATTLTASLKARGLATDHSATTAFATPRRLAVHISAVRSEGDPQQLSIKLVPEAIAYDASGSPTPQLASACVKKAGFPSLAAALELGAFVARDDGGKRYVFHEMLAAGQSLVRALQDSLDEALAKLPIPEVMSYQLEDGWSSVSFARPAHGLVALHGADVVSVTALGLTSGRNTQGHRFEAQMNPVVLQDADHYAQQLEQQGAVIAAFDHRRADIARQLQHAAAPLGLVPIDDDALLDEVTALVERPTVLLCQFETEFLAVPSECLILTMKANQKYFPLLDAQGKLTHKFLVVSNIRPEDPSAIVQGNERVVRPRLADAKFFFDQDRRKTLESRLPMLDKVVYHAKLGKLADRVRRVGEIAQFLAGFPDLRAEAKVVDRAAKLMKCDLVTDMVGEFPELQGVMGRYYALSQHEPAEVATAIEEHYLPRFAGDTLPKTPAGTVVALADKLEAIAGLFSIGEIPTGDKDPYALRRHALGILRICLERPVNVPLNAMVGAAVNSFAGSMRGTDTPWRILAFFYDRLAVMMKDRGYKTLAIDAVFAAVLRDGGHTAAPVEAVVSDQLRDIGDVPRRLAAVQDFMTLPEAASLADANKRITNILKKSDAAPAASIDEKLLIEPAERALLAALTSVAPLADKLYDNGEYTASLRELAVLKAPVYAFFESVMVNAPEADLRANRLALLRSLHAAMNRVADLSKLAS